MNQYLFITFSDLVDAPAAMTDPVILPFALGDQRGILVAASDLDAFLARYSLHPTGAAIPTGYESILLLTLSSRHHDYTVTVTNWNGNGLNLFRDCAQKFARQISRNVILGVPHNNVSVPPATPDACTILIWSAPRGKGTIKPPKQFRNIPIVCHDLAFPPSGDGIPLTDPATGYVAAELIGTTLYILHDICHTGTANELKLFQLLLDQTATILNETNASPTARDTLDILDMLEIEQLFADPVKPAATKHTADHKRSRQAYVKLCRERLTIDKAAAREQLTRATADITRLQTELMLVIRQATTAQAQLDGLAVPADQEQFYHTEFDRLTELDLVRQVTVTPHTIEVLTDTIHCTDPRDNTVHEIGRFKITVQTNGGEMLHFANLDRQPPHPNGRQNMHAPHVGANGIPCLGNLQEVIPTLVGRHDYSALVSMAIAFLQTVNINDGWGISIVAFPITKKPKK